MRNKDIKKALDGYFAVLSSYQPVYSTYAGGIYEMELTRAAIHCFATHCSKLKPEVVGHAAPALGRVLQFKPNPLMDTKKYLYRLATAYMTDNNAIIAPLIEFDEIKGFYPLTVGKVQLMEHDGQTFVRYDMGGGEYFAVELERCGILNQFQYTSELWGESNLCLRPTLELMDAQTQGILNGIKNSAVIRFIAKLANALNPKDVKKEQERLKEINLGINNTAGVFVIDQKYEDVRQIDSKPYIINPSQMEYIKQNVFTYFGVNEHILQNCFTPDEWNAYYEGKIEPFALEIGLVHTNMTFTERERSFGNQIFFSTNRLQYAGIQDKINYVVQMGDRGRTSINEDREVFNLPPVEGGDRHFIRGEYRPVDSYDEAVEPLTDENETQPFGNSDTLDKAVSGGIMEERDYIQNPDTGLMEGSTPEGGSGSGESDGGGQEGASEQSGDEVPYYAGLKDKLSAIRDKIKEKTTSEKYKEASQEYLGSLPKLSEPESMEQALAATNPKGYEKNCQRCVPVYEMRRRGYDVTAADIPKTLLEDNIGLYDYKNVFVGAKWTACKGTGQEEITDYLQKCGDGTRVEISIRIEGGGHLFVGHKHNGQVIFVDPQKGKANAEDRFLSALDGCTEYARIDDLKLSNLIKDCVEE